ncbi:MAG: BlaI/MecI/CopY family transcriptional regulator [Bacteroidales bacterium]|nr:BlaI/MecI/CopY family transcriptional regulator [Bacteroidales bacterium]
MNKLTGKEEEVMEMIWKIGPCAPKDVVAEYEEPKPHINTIATMFQSLERKGYLIHEAKGRGYIYSAAIAQEDYGRSKFTNFVNRYFDNSYMNVVSALVQEEKISKSELLDFLKKLEEK